MTDDDTGNSLKKGEVKHDSMIRWMT
jgi:hypothetical protein